MLRLESFSLLIGLPLHSPFLPVFQAILNIKLTLLRRDLIAKYQKVEHCHNQTKPDGTCKTTHFFRNFGNGRESKRVFKRALKLVDQLILAIKTLRRMVQLYV